MEIDNDNSNINKDYSLTDNLNINTKLKTSNSNNNTNDELSSKNIRTLVDANHDIFRYGLQKLESNIYEDPTFLGYTIELDENSALFTDVLPFIETRMTTCTELSSRISVYKEFVNKIRQVFNSQDSVVSPNEKLEFIKQHYINSISGMDILQKKFIKWKEDKLTFELHEDISMFSTYLAYLYNNLTYSYENGRVLIPENLLKFNCYIKISEIRNLTSIKKLVSNNTIDLLTVNALKNNTTSIIYKLYDCQFDFFGSKPFENDMILGGIDAPTMPHSILNFDLYLKRVSKSIYTPLINNSITMNDDNINLDIVIVKLETQDGDKSSYNANSSFSREAFHNAENKKPSSINTYENEIKFRPDIKEQSDLQELKLELEKIKSENAIIESESQEEMNIGLQTAAGWSNSEESIVQTDPLNQFVNKTKSTIKSAGKIQKDKLNNELNRKKNELIKSFVNDVKDKVGIKKIIPDNIYDDNDKPFNNILNQFGSQVGNNVANDIINTLTNNNPIL